MVRLNKIPKEEGIDCEILVKCEYLNPSGSMKDRIAVRMLEDAEKEKRINKETKIFEPSSGNTGIALGMVCAVKGYDLTVFMSEKMSSEKNDMMVAVGAKVIRTPQWAGYHDALGLY
jgi:cystathionine beta-synthase